MSVAAETVEVTPPAASPPAGSPPAGSGRRSVAVDALIVIALFGVALTLRWNFPTDGLFYDDAWQALGPAKGSLSQLFAVAEGQPGYALGLMGWSRVFGDGPSSMVTPALIAGALGPPALFLTLRSFRFARSIALFLGATLCVVGAHISFSSHVKAYTADVLVVLFVSVVVAWLAPQRWSVRVAVGWVIGALLVASFSAVGPLVSVAGGAVLVLHPRGDSKRRLVAVGAQYTVIAVYVALILRTFNSGLVNAYWTTDDAFIHFSMNPFQLGPSIVEHLVRITAVFSDDRRPLAYVVLAISLAGLAGAAWRGPRVVPARFLGLVLLAALGGGVLGRVPFGPASAWGGRISIWLAPVIAFGLAAAFDFVRRRMPGPVAVRALFDAMALGVTIVVVVGAAGASYEHLYPGARMASRQVVLDQGPNDAVWITPPTVYSFALAGGAPFRIRATPDAEVGYEPAFDDPRLVALTYRLDRDALKETLEGVDRMFILHASISPPSALAQYRLAVALTLHYLGFKRRAVRVVGTGSIEEWDRPQASPTRG